MKISVLYGTETGNAEMLAEDITSALEEDHQVTCQNLADTNPNEFDQEAFHVFVCSTYDDGELPSSARPFAERIEKGAPDLSGLHYAIFGLGDAEYEATFAFGSRKLAELLNRHGANQIGERLTHDAAGDDLPEDLAVPWVQGILNQVSDQTEDA